MRPLIESLALRCGHRPDDAADIAQETMCCVVRGLQHGRYAADRGELKFWILGIARNKIAKHREKRVRQQVVRGDSALEALADSFSITRVVAGKDAVERMRAALHDLISSTRINKVTLAAFQDVVLHKLHPAEVAARHGISIEAVYVAKHRCLSRLRKFWEQGPADG